MKIVKMPRQNTGIFQYPVRVTKVIANEFTKEVTEKAKKVRNEVTDKLMTAIASAFAFVIALTWNNTIQNAVNKIVAKFGIPQTALFYNFLGAVIVTIICVFGIMFASKYGEKKQQ